MRRLPSPRSWKRKAIGSLVVLAMLPVFPVIAFMAVDQAVALVGHILGIVWPWLAAIVFVLGGRYLLRAFYRRRW